MTEWQPIETAPKDGNRILGFTSMGIIEIYWGGYFEWSQDVIGTECGGDICFEGNISHWMPLPPPPKNQQAR